MRHAQPHLPGTSNVRSCPPPPHISTCAPKRWLGNCDYGFPAKATYTAAGAGAAPGNNRPSAANSTVPASASSGPAPAAPTEGKGEAGKPNSTRGSAEAKEEEGMVGVLLSGAFEDAARHLEAAKAGVGEARWQG